METTLQHKRMRWTMVVLMFGFCLTFSAFPRKISVALNVTNFDGSKINVQPGDTISIQAGARDHLRFANIKGDSLSHVVFINEGGLVKIATNTNLYGINLVDCSFFRFTGTGSASCKYGILISHTPYGRSGLSIDGASTNYEVDHIEVCNTGFAGICANPKPDCDDRLNRPNFCRRNTEFHDNYIHSTACEGLYIGHTFYAGYTISCDSTPKKVLPHELHGLKIYNNIVDSAGWDAIQVGSATQGCMIYNNTITNYATKNVTDQKYGIILNPGTGGECFNNLILKGSGTGIGVFGIGGNKIYNNIIVAPGSAMNDTMITSRSMGIFCDDRNCIPGRSFMFVNNTIIAPKGDGIRFYTDKSAGNRINNNLVLHPGTYGTYGAWLSPNTCYVNVQSGSDVTISTNYFSNALDTGYVFNDAQAVYDYCKELPVIDAGTEVLSYGIYTDFYNNERRFNGITDIGAIEYPFTPLPGKQSVKIVQMGSGKTLRVYTEKKEIIRRICIFEISGQLIKYYEPKTDEATVDMNTLPAKGVYLVCTSTDNDEYKNKISLNF